MRWPSWATLSSSSSSSSSSTAQDGARQGPDRAQSTPTLPQLPQLLLQKDKEGEGEEQRQPQQRRDVVFEPSSWSSPNLPNDWRYYASPGFAIPCAIMCGGVLAGRWLYASYVRRIAGTSRISGRFWRRRSLFGAVTSVGDGDGFRMFHTPGGRLAGWGWLRKVPRGSRALKDKTDRNSPPEKFRSGLTLVQISIRIAGVDAPETAHFGKPAQRGAQEALDWLRGYIGGRRVRAYIYRRDQYERAVATVYVRKGLWRRDVGLELLRRGLATVYEAKTGAEFGSERLEHRYRKAEGWAQLMRRGIWAGGKLDFESPRDYKTRMKISEW